MSELKSLPVRWDDIFGEDMICVETQTYALCLGRLSSVRSPRQTPQVGTTPIIQAKKAKPTLRLAQPEPKVGAGYCSIP